MPKMFVTGGSRGIGAALVVVAARRGWDVAFSYRRAEDEAHRVAEAAAAARPDGTYGCFALDVRDATAVDAVADRVLDHLGGVDAIVCNAGITHNDLAYAMTDETWSDVLETNLGGSFRVSRAFLPELVAQRSGSIVMMSSVVAEGASGQAAYAASKAGLHGLASTLAKEYGPKGVRANVVVPGYFETDMTRQEMTGQLREFATSYCPQRRMGELDEVCNAVLFLAGADSGFVNGTTLRVTGGLDWAP
jgi:NAD(P)-dependent dehydrogenase (short-subunit alcohol dehydrogenase family)